MVGWGMDRPSLWRLQQGVGGGGEGWREVSRGGGHVQSQDPRGLVGVWPEQQLAPTEQGLTCPDWTCRLLWEEGWKGIKDPHSHVHFFIFAP